MIPYNPYEADTAAAPLALTFDGTPSMGIAVTSKEKLPMDDPADYKWIAVGVINGIKMAEKDYTWIKFADSAASKQPLSDFPSASKNWVGISVGRSHPNESVNASDYIWHKVGSKDNRIDLGNGKILTIRFAKGDKGQMFHPLAPSFKTRHILGTDRSGISLPVLFTVTGLLCPLRCW